MSIMSKNKVSKFTFTVNQLYKSEFTLSYKSKANSKDILVQCAKQLYELGYCLPSVRSLKQKHIQALVNLWKADGLSERTIKNRLAVLRKSANLMGRSNIILRNEDYGLAKYTNPIDNRALENIDISKFTNKHIRFSVRLQKEFGLRREESLKFSVGFADKGDHILLKGSWTKGNVERIIPIRTQEQRELLDEIRKNIGVRCSLIPKDKTNKEQINRYIVEVANAGYRNLHGLRYAYAQRRYREITDKLTKGHGWECPFKGGKLKKEMTREDSIVDRKARFVISNELGHSRLNITNNYLGKA